MPIDSVQVSRVVRADAIVAYTKRLAIADTEKMQAVAQANDDTVTISEEGKKRSVALTEQFSRQEPDKKPAEKPAEKRPEKISEK